jgi:predicted small lipoprotein YifL
MKSLLFLAVTVLTVAGCKGPINITGNPDDHTTTSGTIGSGKMTNELPKKSDNMKIPDTISRTKDTLRRN